MTTILILAVIALACYTFIAIVGTREVLAPLAQRPAVRWRNCEYYRTSTVSHCYEHWSAEDVHEAADNAYFDGNLELRDTLRSVAQAIEIRERIVCEQRRQRMSVRPTVQVRSLGAGA